ncbi:D-glycero-alpha-D-manno-heptose-1,7-bisphosphate 7-phosphatase [Oleiharenicola lentus]|uniref:D-glycero-alpha-D-manno-heptose-1,7-bisphosphate 7-phosphatase n=1 Tax=Oleiharenicola lentus TaxID=2508720 RepID=UPI003F6780A0
MTKRRAVFLDRDGTLNAPVVREGKPYPPDTVAEFQLLPGVTEGCRRLHAAGYVLIIVTNQPDVGRGTQSQAVVETIHAHLHTLIPELARIETCYAPGKGVSHPENYRRKPEPGMLTDAAHALDIDLTASWMIGDRWRDVDCGARAGCQTIFIDRNYDEALRTSPNFTVHSFEDAVGIVLAGNSAAC